MPSPAFRRESTQSYIQSVLGLCKKSKSSDERRRKVSHLMKVLLRILSGPVDPRKSTTQQVYQMVQLYRRYEAEESWSTRFERLPNVVPVASLTDETDLCQQKPTETRPRPTYAAVTRKYRAPVQKFPPEQENRCGERLTTDLFLFHCGRPGHVMRYCRERLSLDNALLETADGTSTTLALKKKKYADQTLLAVTPSPTRGRSPIRRYRSPSPYRRSSQSRATVDKNELVLEDISVETAAPDAWNLYATRDYTLKPHSLTRITVSGYQNPRRHKCSSRRQQTFALRENIATPSMVSTYRNGKVRCLGYQPAVPETKSSLEECA
ncbi:CCHC-type domain-containing protein [Trichonephila clavipes]|nr:CCHC-type domain-containing protein [Trichonephila clavipes]